MTRLILTVALSLALAAPAAAVPLLEGPGNFGVTLSHRFMGVLGPTGLDVQATPTMLMVRRLAAGSIAAILGVPDPERYRVRVAAVNGQPVEKLRLAELLRAFNPSAKEVRLTFARKAEADPAEIFMGPFELPLVPKAIAEVQSRWLATRGRFAEAQALLNQRQAGAAFESDAVLLAARDVAAAGDYLSAIAQLRAVPAHDPLYAEARRLNARYLTAYYQDVLVRADRLAATGAHQQAIQALAELPREDVWHKQRVEREGRWREAIAMKESHRAQKTVKMQPPR